MTGPSHVYVTYIRCTPEALWTALTDPDWTVQYFHSTRIASSFDEGAEVTYALPDGSLAAEGVVIECDPPRRLCITWRALYDPVKAAERPSRVTFEIEPQGDVCRLTLLHDDFDGETETYKTISQGWAPILCSLKTLLETGAPMPMPA